MNLLHSIDKQKWNGILPRNLVDWDVPETQNALLHIMSIAEWFNEQKPNSVLWQDQYTLASLVTVFAGV